MPKEMRLIKLGSPNTKLIDSKETKSISNENFVNQPLDDLVASEKASKYKFIEKLLEILSTDHMSQAIQWNQDGNIIEIKNEQYLLDNILPIHFKQSSIANFYRQLNMYGFKKLKNYRYSGVAAYYHPLFRKGANKLISEINRKGKAFKRTNYNHYEHRQGKKEDDYEDIDSLTDSSIELSLKETCACKSINDANLVKIDLLEKEVESLSNENKGLKDFNYQFAIHLSSKDKYISHLEAFISLLIPNSGLPQNLSFQSDTQLLNNSGLSGSNTENVIDAFNSTGSSMNIPEQIDNYIPCFNNSVMFGYQPQQYIPDSTCLINKNPFQIHDYCSAEVRGQEAFHLNFLENRIKPQRQIKFEVRKEENPKPKEDLISKICKHKKNKKIKLKNLMSDKANRSYREKVISHLSPKTDDNNQISQPLSSNMLSRISHIDLFRRPKK